MASRTEEYSFKDGVFSVDISGVKHDYYQKTFKLILNRIAYISCKLA